MWTGRAAPELCILDSPSAFGFLNCEDLARFAPRLEQFRLRQMWQGMWPCIEEERPDIWIVKVAIVPLGVSTRV